MADKFLLVSQILCLVHVKEECEMLGQGSQVVKVSCGKYVSRVSMFGEMAAGPGRAVQGRIQCQ